MKLTHYRRPQETTIQEIPGPLSKKAGFLASGVFFGIVLKILLTAPAPALPPLPAGLLQAYLQGNERPFVRPGAEYAHFKGLLPPQGPVTFLMDVPFTSYARGIEKLYAAQIYFTPLILNPEPGERAAIIDCTGPLMAEVRLQQTGYRMIAKVADGKGMAVRQ